MPAGSPVRAWGTRRIRGLRGPKNALDPRVPYAFFADEETGEDGRPLRYAVILITNRECPFSCLMCDLWVNTLDETVPDGAVAAQVRHALARLGPVDALKLYNAGSFFDPRAIPPADLDEIARIGRGYRRVVVEAHPAFVGGRAVSFHRALGDRLEVAIGLETANRSILEALNKSMTLEDYRAAVEMLTGHGIPVRTFLLLPAPFLSGDAAIEETLRSLDAAQDAGSTCVVIIPTRTGNGSLDVLEREGRLQPPTVEMLERALEHGLSRERGRVFADTWDLDRLAGCSMCRTSRIARIRAMNHDQRIPTRIPCRCVPTAAAGEAT